jgi:hypothetical protein
MAFKHGSLDPRRAARVSYGRHFWSRALLLLLLALLVSVIVGLGTCHSNGSRRTKTHAFATSVRQVTVGVFSVAAQDRTDSDLPPRASRRARARCAR